MKKVTILGIDIAKQVFQLHGRNERGQDVLKKKLKRAELKKFIANLPKSLIGMEACGGAHYWAREFRKLGHEVKLISPQYVKPYVKTNKNDSADAEAICEALSRPGMRFVPIKEIYHQDIQCLHRIRSRLVANKTALGNEIRGFLGEYGMVVSKGKGALKRKLPLILEDAQNDLTMRAREFLSSLLEELKDLEERIKKNEQEIQRIYEENEVCQRIGKVEGVGPLTATAIVATVMDAKAFRNGRQLSAYLGLVPRQHSSGGKSVLLGISKRGDPYLRCLLIHGARAALKHAKSKSTRRFLWALEKQRTRGFNRTCVAWANKNARIIWALMAKGEEYRVA